MNNPYQEPEEPLYWLLREAEEELVPFSRDYLEADTYPELAGALVEEYLHRLQNKAFAFVQWYTHTVLPLRLQSFRTQRRILGFLKQYTRLPLIPTTTAY